MRKHMLHWEDDEDVDWLGTVIGVTAAIEVLGMDTTGMASPTGVISIRTGTCAEAGTCE